MCFTVNINLTRNALESRFGAKFRDPSSFRPGYYFNAFEIPDLPVIQAEDPESINLVKWGLIPFWVRDSKAASEIRLKTFNARAETIREKPSFRGAVKSKRCLILCRGFYEWQHRGSEKIPHYIYLEGERPMAMAGVYDNWTDRDSGETGKPPQCIPPGVQRNPGRSTGVIWARGHSPESGHPPASDCQS